MSNYARSDAHIPCKSKSNSRGEIYRDEKKVNLTFVIMNIRYLQGK